MIRLAALACGFLCGGGFVLSGLYDPALVEAFLKPKDAGSFAIGLALLVLIVVTSFLVVIKRRVDEPLLGGRYEPLPFGTGWKGPASALLFGVGWGIAGYFPMAALVSAGTFSSGAPIFLVSVLTGMILCDVISGGRKSGRGRKGSFG
jgi:hypothetical protein